MSYTFTQTGSEIQAILDRAEAGGQIDQDIAAKAPLASPALTGDPTAPTQSEGDNSAKLATTAYADRAARDAASAAYPTDSVAPGDVVSFSDGADGIPVKSFVGSIVPSQNLNGQSAPYPAGGGKNKVEGTVRAATTSNGITSQVYANNRLTMSGTATGNGDAYFIFTSPLVLANGSSYTVSWSGTDNRSRGMNVFLYTGSSFPMYVTAGTDAHSVTFTPSSDITITGIMFRMTVGGTVTAFDCNIQLESGSTATDYAPYSNICPISGWTEANITRVGKNLFDYAKAGNITIPSGAVRSGEIIRISAGNWTVGKANAGDAIYAGWNDGEAHEVSLAGITSALVSAATDCDLYVWRGGGSSITGVANIQVEKGSTATAYEAYQGDTILLDFGQTVYGGTLDPVAGKLFVTMATVDLGTLDWTYDSTYSRMVSTTPITDMIPINAARVTWALCERYQVIDDGRPLSGVPNCSLYLSFGQAATEAIVYVHDSAYTDATVFKAAVSGTKMVYLLRTTTENNIAPQTLSTLLGANTVWTDVGGVTEMEYRADTALYIQKLLNGGGTLSTLSMASPSPSLSLGRVGVLAEPEEVEPEQTGEEAEQTEEPEQTEEA